MTELDRWAERQIRQMELESQNIPDYSNRGQEGQYEGGKQND